MEHWPNPPRASNMMKEQVPNIHLPWGAGSTLSTPPVHHCSEPSEGEEPLFIDMPRLPHPPKAPPAPEILILLPPNACSGGYIVIFLFAVGQTDSCFVFSVDWKVNPTLPQNIQKVCCYYYSKAQDLGLLSVLLCFLHTVQNHAH